jgi:glycosyltransferase involved in cell wall biosynthesis
LPDVVLVAGRDPRSEPGGGHSAYVRAHGYAALAAGFTPHLVCVGASAETATTEYGLVHRVESSAFPYRQLAIAGHVQPLAREVVRLVQRTGARVVHGFGVWSCAAVAARDRLRKRGVVVRALSSSYTTLGDETRSKVAGLSPSSPVLSRFLYRAEAAWIRWAVVPWEHRAYAEADLVLVNYASVERLVRAAYGPSVALRRISYGAEPSFRTPGPAREKTSALLDPLAPAGAPLIVTIARHDPRKGGDVLLEALSLLTARGVSFRACLAGPGPLLDAHRRLAERLGLGGSTRVAGLVENAFDLLREADVFVLASRREQSGSLAVLEAMQAGKTIVASACDGVPEDITHDGNGILVPPGDAEALAAALAALLADPDRRTRLGAAARETYEARFSPAAFSGALGALYREEESG